MATGIGERLRYYRTLRGMGQAQLAEQLGMPLNTISKIEHGARKLTFEEAVQVAEILRISLHALAGTPPQGNDEAVLQMEVARACLHEFRNGLTTCTSALSRLETLTAHA